MLLSIIILNYKQKNLTRECVKGILDLNLEFNYEIILVDNNSKDYLRELVKKRFINELNSGLIKFIQSDRNLGMGAGNNLGIRTAQGEYILILNPDVVVFDNAIERLLNFIQADKKIGCVAPMLLDPNKKYQQSRYRFPTFFMFVYLRTGLFPNRRKKFKWYFMEDVPINEPHKVDWVRGSALMLRKSVLDKISGFDRRFFMYMEDIDLCRKIWHAGYEVWYLPKAKIVHYYGKRSGELGIWRWLRDLLKPLAWIHISSWLKYFWKWSRYNLQQKN